MWLNNFLDIYLVAKDAIYLKQMHGNLKVIIFSYNSDYYFAF